MTHLAQTHVLIGLGRLATRDVKVEHRFAGLKHIHLQRAVACPVFINLDEVGHGGRATGLLCKILTFCHGSLANGRIQNQGSALLSDVFHHLRIDGANHLGVELALGEARDFCCHG